MPQYTYKSMFVTAEQEKGSVTVYPDGLQVHSGEWLVIEQDGTRHVVNEHLFGALYKQKEPTVIDVVHPSGSPQPYADFHYQDTGVPIE